MNNVILIGRLTRDPELRYTTGGTAVARFTIAVDKQLSKEKKDEFEAQGKPTADFIRCISWGKQAEVVSEYTAKGLMVAVNGRIETGSYQDQEGRTIYTTDVVTNQVKFLQWKDNQSNNSQNEPVEGFEYTDDENIPF